MSQTTKSEALFEEFCRSRDIGLRRITEATVPGWKRPDYFIKLGKQCMVVEIKQFDPNPDDQRVARELDQVILSREIRAVTRGIIEPGKRVSAAIDDSNKQLKRLDWLGLPDLLVIYNNVPEHDYTDPYHIRTGMYGLEAVIFRVPRALQQRPYVISQKFGQRQKMRPNEKTRISAIGVLSHHMEKGPQLTVYHNNFANTPVEPNLLRPFVLTQFRLGEKKDHLTFQDWDET